MKIFSQSLKRNQKFFIILLRVLVPFSLFMTSIFLYIIDGKSALFVYAAIIALYPLFKVITAYPSFNFTLDKNRIKFIPLLTLLLSFFNMFLSLYLWFGNNPFFMMLSLRPINTLISYLTPYLIIVTILVTFNYLNEKVSLKHPLVFFLLALGLFVLQVSSRTSTFIHYFILAIMTLLFGWFLYFLWDSKDQLSGFLYTYIHLLISLTLFTETISLLNKYYYMPSTYILLIVFIAYILITIDLQYYLMKHYISSSTKQLLYEKNSRLMDSFLKLKSIEVDNLEYEMLIKDNVYKQWFDFSPEAFLIVTNGSISYSNNALINLLDANDSCDILGKKLWDFIHPSSIDAASICYYDLLSGKRDTIKLEIQLLSLGDKIKDVRVSSNITFLEDTHYIFCSFHDLSAYYEQERLKLKLENNIAQEKFKVEFFANISHDLKTPINVIYSAIQLQDIHMFSKEYDKVLVYNTIIKQNCLRLQKLLNDILDITKIDAKHFNPKLELCNIISTIEYITQSISSYVKDKNITIIFDTNVEDKFVKTDSNLIERIMLNLISNAIKYGKEDGHIWINLHDEGDHLIISIRDDGIGIPNSHIPNIFNRFHKSDTCSDTSVTGNGIGLSLVRSIVEVLGGLVFCLSEEGIGSEFIVILPMCSKDYDEDHYSQYAASLDLTSNLNLELSDI